MKPRLETGSFRDRSSRVFYADGHVCRFLDSAALEEWQFLSQTAFFKRRINGTLIATHRLEPPPVALHAPWVAVLEHARLQFISYPYEWSFSMLKNAAHSHLEILEDALKEGMILRDCSPFNIQWAGTKPLFIDIPSFARVTPGDPWVAYRQFTRMFFYPLLMQAYKGVPFQRWLRAHLEGLPAEDMSRFFGWWEFWRPGLFFDVFLQARFENRWASSDRKIRTEMKDAGFQQEMILRNVRRLKRIVEKLTWRRDESQWSHYADQCNYSSEDYANKLNFVRTATALRRWKLVWDLGCNMGDFSRLAAEHADFVVALDADEWVVEKLYQNLSAEHRTNILPLVMNLADPPPSQGWWGLERKSLWARHKPDLVLALALLHHLVISAHVPLAEVVAWMASLEAEIVVEFVEKTDPMVQKLLLNKDDIYTEYTRENFESLLSQQFKIREKISLVGGKRHLYHAVPKKK